MTDRERFVPRRVADVADRLAALPVVASVDTDADGSTHSDTDGSTHSSTDADDGRRWSPLVRLVSALYHFEFHSIEQRTTGAWDRIDTDPSAAPEVTGDLTGLLDGANYTPVTDAELDAAMENEALIPLRLDVDFDLYDELLIYRRGVRSDVVDRPRFLRSPDSVEITVDDDVVVHSRLKSAAWFAANGIDAEKREVVPGTASLKQFRDVPRADIEMLLPATRVRFRTIDTLKIAVPAAASAVVVLATKLLPTLALLFVLAGSYVGLRDDQPDIDQAALLILFGGTVALGGFVFKQWSKLKNRRIDYLKTLSESLYFRTVADGPGVFHILLAAAEEQEVNEALIAYRLLLAAASAPTADELDLAAEQWIRESFDRDVDFEVSDALGKLSRLGIAAADADGRWTPVQMSEALVVLDRHWDDLFEFAAQADADLDDGGATSGSRPGSAGERGEVTGVRALLRFRRVVGRFRSRLGDRATDDRATDG